MFKRLRSVVIDLTSRFLAFTYRRKCRRLRNELERNWSNMTDSERYSSISTMLDEAHCNSETVSPFLFKLFASASDPINRYMSFSRIADLDGIKYRDFLLETLLNDADEDIRKLALLGLFDSFGDQIDFEILKLSLRIYDDPKSSLSLRLTAGAAMMYQLNIPHDEQGRPAWWHYDDEEELEHPAIQEAVSRTKQILQQNE